MTRLFGIWNPVWGKIAHDCKTALGRSIWFRHLRGEMWGRKRRWLLMEEFCLELPRVGKLLTE